MWQLLEWHIDKRCCLACNDCMQYNEKNDVPKVNKACEIKNCLGKGVSQKD